MGDHKCRPQSLVQGLRCILHCNQRGNLKLALRERELTFTEFYHEPGTLLDLVLDLTTLRKLLPSVLQMNNLFKVT